MHEFRTFVYLDMQKTGSSFISAVLDRFCTEESIRLWGHKPMESDCDRSKFYFISVRNPIDAYLSLYSYGCQSQGGLRTRLAKHDLDRLYDGTMEGFGEWLRYLLKPKNIDVLFGTYARLAGGAVAELLGLQSFRYLRLALPDPTALLSGCRTRDDIRAVYREHRLPQAVIRHETFARDLCALLEGPLRHAIGDLEGAVNFVRHSPPINASERIDLFESEIALGNAVRRRFFEREWFLHEEFGY
ncbi:MAG TPA: hypothetical protein VG819_10140 [Rhizomicrobium sp.]|jgi:hypothetical protein|nr:hypothetical protein [Rhizomicrobium sp.]